MRSQKLRVQRVGGRSGCVGGHGVEIRCALRAQRNVWWSGMSLVCVMRCERSRLGVCFPPPPVCNCAYISPWPASCPRSRRRSSPTPRPAQTPGCSGGAPSSPTPGPPCTVNSQPELDPPPSLEDVDNVPFPGLAIVAHSIDPNKLRNAHGGDPFDPNQSSPRLSATCLELEMMRGRDLHAQGFATLLPDQVREPKSSPSTSHHKGGRSAKRASLLKGKGPASVKESLVDIPFSEVESDPDVKLYIDPRCGHTRDWIMANLCHRDLDHAGRWTSDALLITINQAVDGRLFCPILPAQKLVS